MTRSAIAHPQSLQDAVASYTALVRDRFRDRKFVLAGISRGRLAPQVEWLRELGAADVFALSARPATDGPRQTHPDPAPPDPSWWDLGLTAPDQDDLGRRFEAVLHDPPLPLARALDAFDPTRTAWVLDTRDLPGPTCVGRRRYGWRRPRWTVAEDKVRVDAVWRRSGIPAAASVVVPATAADLAAAVHLVGGAAGTVWAADARDGLHTGARGTRWMPPGADPGRLAGEFAARSDQVRVMPYLPGLPCSVHGLVLPTEVIALRPLELLTLRRPDGRFVFAGTSTFWNCPEPAYTEIRTAARAVGRALRELYGYRGGFTLDGVLTDEGFRPTEVNARLGSGLNFAETCPSMLLPFLNRLVQEGEDVDYRPALLERTILAALAQAPSAEAKLPLTGFVAPGVEVPLCRSDEPGGLRVARDGEPVDVVVSSERSAVGDRLRFRPVGTAFRGASLAPVLVAATAIAERLLDVDCGLLKAGRPLSA